jgi:hypothetical protein
MRHEALNKFESRAQEWDWGQIGIQHTMTIYNIYVAPALLYLAQLEEVGSPGPTEADARAG